MVVRTNTTMTEKNPNRVAEGFEFGLAIDNAAEASGLISAGEAALKISVYPWGAEFDVVDRVPPNGEEENQNVTH